MRKRFKYPLNFVGLLLSLGLVFLFCYYLYYEVITDSTIVVDQSISINYLSSSKITNSNNNNLEFSVSNNSNEDVMYYVMFENVNCNNEVEYEIIYNDVTESGLFENGVILDNILIKSGETHNYKLNINNNSDSDINGSFVVKQVVDEEILFNELILQNNEVKLSSVTNIGKEVSTTNEGLIQLEDGDKYSYYFRGAVDNNYVSFASYNWRIVGINLDNSIKLVLDGEITMSSYNSNNTLIEYENSDISTLLNDWYNTNLLYYSDVILNNEFCNDNSLVDNNNYAAYNRVVLNNIATNTCLGTKVNNKIGLLTIDEVIYAGGSSNSGNSSYYLYNSSVLYDFYTMSGAKNQNNIYYPFMVSPGGEISYDTTADVVRSVRPVINVTNNILVDGAGTIDNPYIINMSNEGE